MNKTEGGFLLLAAFGLIFYSATGRTKPLFPAKPGETLQDTWKRWHEMTPGERDLLIKKARQEKRAEKGRQLIPGSDIILKSAQRPQTVQPITDYQKALESRRRLEKSRIEEGQVEEFTWETEEGPQKVRVTVRRYDVCLGRIKQNDYPLLLTDARILARGLSHFATSDSVYITRINNCSNTVERWLGGALVIED
jgi:hypothetical protein